MKIRLLGTGTGVPSERRNPPSVLMEFGGKHAIFDSGPGTLPNLLRFGVDQLNLDFLFYTHFHLDHISDFAAILFAAKIPPSIRKKPLVVYGPGGLKEYYKKIMDLYKQTLYTDAYRLELREIENQTIQIGDFSITTMSLEHHDGGMGYRICTPDGKNVVYSGDTDYCDNIIELSRDADLLMLECAFPDEMKMKGHLTPIEAGKVARQSRAKKLILMHMYPVCDQYDLVSQCKKEFNGEVIAGEDFMEVTC
ncbi:MBL fold metallo-hydrolase [Candidatus Omnitrophota bacterium]